MSNRVRDYTVFDLEMTGLSATDNKIIEIGAIHIRDGQMADTYTAMINPHVRISPIVVRMTGITDAMLRKGVEEDGAVQGLIDFIGTDVIVGHSVENDFFFVKQWAVNHKVPLELWACDTLAMAKALVPEEQSKKLGELCKYFSIERIHAHRALEDAIETWQLYEILADMAEQENRSELLEPKLLKGKRKRQTPATKRQKQLLKEYMKSHGIQEELPWDTLTRRQASRKLDQYRVKYGKYDALQKKESTQKDSQKPYNMPKKQNAAKKHKVSKQYGSSKHYTPRKKDIKLDRKG